MTRNSRNLLLRIVFALIIISGISAVIFYLIKENRHFENVYNEKINELQNVITTATKNVYCAKEPLKAGTIIDDNCVEKMELITEKAGYITENDFGKILLVDVPSGTEIMQVMISGATVDTELREIEYDWLEVSSNISPLDYVDVRIAFPDGTDYVILAKKRIQGLSETKLVCDLWNSEEEILLLDSASVDAFLYKGARIYMTRYILPNIQNESIVNYTPSEQTIELIKENPNIVKVANEYLSLEIRKKHETRIGIFLNNDEVKERYDKNGVYIGTPTDADLYAENFLNNSHPIGTELPKEYGGELWD